MISAAASRLAVGRRVRIGRPRSRAGPGVRASRHRPRSRSSPRAPAAVRPPGGSGRDPVAGAGRRPSRRARWRQRPSRHDAEMSCARTSSSRSSAAPPAVAVRTSARPPPGCSRLVQRTEIAVAHRRATRSRATPVGTSATVRVACTASTNGTLAAGVGGSVAGVAWTRGGRSPGRGRGGPTAWVWPARSRGCRGLPPRRQRARSARAVPPGAELSRSSGQRRWPLNRVRRSRVSPAAGGQSSSRSAESRKGRPTASEPKPRTYRPVDTRSR